MIKKGTINVILGLNGCGKTTVIKILSGINNNYRGEVLYNNLNFKKLSYDEKSKLISYVPQKIEQINDILVKDYLTFGFVNQINFFSEPSNEQYKSILIKAKEFKVEQFLERKLGELSGGQQKLIYIIGALLQNSETIILDEPVAALDLNKESLILNTLKEIQKNENKTIILSTHDHNHINTLNANAILMKDVKIIDYLENNEPIFNKIEDLKKIYNSNLYIDKTIKSK